MASANATQGLDLEKELTCSICAELLYQPLTLLDCLHTFCGLCLKEWFGLQNASARAAPSSAPPRLAPYTCPSCRAPTRETKPNATVTTLLDMFLGVNPSKGRAAEEKEEMRAKYTPGENVMPRVEARERTLRERRMEDEDERLTSGVRELSLREAGVRSTRHRSHETRVRSSRENSRDARNSAGSERRRRHADSDTEVRERRRRHGRSNTDARRHGDENTGARSGAGSSADRRQRRTEEQARRRHEETSRTAARQIEHQSSFRSLISTSDVDSYEMQEEILRQIRDEGLLDGIDWENIDVQQEDQISERIAEAFRRRQLSRPAQTSTRPSHSSPRPTDALRSAPRSRGASRDRNGRGADGSRSRPVNGRSHSDEPSRASTIRLEPHSGDENRRLRGSRRATSPIPYRSGPNTRPASRSQTDIANQPLSAHDHPSRPAGSARSRGTTQAPPPPRRSEEMIVSHESPVADRHVETTSELVRGMPLTISAANPGTPRAPYQASLSIQPPAQTATMDVQALMPEPLSPRGSRHSMIDRDIARSPSTERALALGNACRPTSSSSAAHRLPSALFPEPSITCSRCSRPHVEYEIHYNCAICEEGNWNLCIACYRSGRGCLHWFGFGAAAWTKWERELEAGLQTVDSEKPHILAAYRYLPPKSLPGGADGRKTLTPEDPANRLQSGAFCMSCLEWGNECYWRCDVCNEGDWGFCNLCVNQGRCCTHALLPLRYWPDAEYVPALTPSKDQATPPSASILTGPGIRAYGAFKPLTFSTTCDRCHYPIPSSSTRYHCFSCTSMTGTGIGDYDICNTCYGKLVSSRHISPENGTHGWRRCLKGHRMITINFEDNDGGQRRVLIQDLVGGRCLRKEPHIPPSSGLQKWFWADHSQTQVRLVTDKVIDSAPLTADDGPDLALTTSFPPDGGTGMVVWARWAWYPKEGEDGGGELLFPRGAEIREVVDVNGDWFWGVYGGAVGLVPGPYVRVLES